MNISKNQEIVLQAIERSWMDESFKSNLIKDPLSTLGSFSEGVFQAPSGKELLFVDKPNFSVNHPGNGLIEELNGKIVVSIPSKDVFDNVQLSEQQMESIAGGGVKWEIFKAYVMFNIL